MPWGAALTGPGTREPPLTVLLADPQPVRRYGLKELLEGEHPDRWRPTVPIRS
ncbi:MAG: hypothetical protein M3R38_10050 [Actinomycetota bacterium]|nr:hypothetical protein [Actinomycetota bacterium]